MFSDSVNRSSMSFSRRWPWPFGSCAAIVGSAFAGISGNGERFAQLFSCSHRECGFYSGEVGKCLDALVSRALARVTRRACAALTFSCFAAPPGPPALGWMSRLPVAFASWRPKRGGRQRKRARSRSALGHSMRGSSPPLAKGSTRTCRPTRVCGAARASGLRCVQGPLLWNVYLPITAKVYGRTLVATTALPAGALLTADDLRVAEIDWTEEPGKWYTQPRGPDRPHTRTRVDS